MTKPLSTSSKNRAQALANGEMVLQPKDCDILCGKDRLCVSHEGSKRFRAVIETYRQQYAATTTKYQKMMITKEIYDNLVQDDCRFLKYNDSANAWEELSPAMARDKVGHALRFANRVNPRKKGKRGRPSKKEMAAQSQFEEVVARSVKSLEKVQQRPEHIQSATSGYYPQLPGPGEQLMLPPQAPREQHSLMVSSALMDDLSRRGLMPEGPASRGPMPEPPRLVSHKAPLTLPRPEQFRTSGHPLAPLTSSMAKESTTPLDSSRGDDTLWTMMDDFITEWDPLNLIEQPNTGMPV